MISNPQDISPRYEGEILKAARRATRMAGAKAPLEYVGMGMTGVVFCDARGRGYKVARRPSWGVTRQMIAEEAEWLRVASTVPSLRGRVARLVRFHRGPSIIERECIRASYGGRGRKQNSLWELHQQIERAMEPYGFSAPEFKEDSYVYSSGRGWVLVDASMPSKVGARLVGRATEILRGRRFLNQRPTDVAYALRMEAGRTIDPAVAKRLSERLEALPHAQSSATRRGHRRDA